jgi:hypothetical protein
MPETTNLAARLKKQMQDESVISRRQMQALINDSRKELTDTYETELSTIKGDTEAQNRNLGWRVFKHRILWPTITGLMLCLGISGGLWGVTQYLGSQLVEKQQRLALMGAEITRREKLLAFLKSEGGAIQFSTCDGRRCIQIDEGAETYENGYRILKGY